jgi:hypothetical protein
MPMIKMMELARRAAKVPFTEADLQCALSSMAMGGSPIQPIFCSAFDLNPPIRRIFHAYPRTKRCSHCSQA